MAGKIIADTLEHSTAGSIDTTWLRNGTAKVWCENATDAVVKDSFNVSSAADTATGKQTVNFTNSLTNEFHANAIVSFDADGVAYVDAKATGSSRWQNYSSGFVDAPIEGVIHGDLA